VWSREYAAEEEDWGKYYPPWWLVWLRHGPAAPYPSDEMADCLKNQAFASPVFFILIPFLIKNFLFIQSAKASSSAPPGRAAKRAEAVGKLKKNEPSATVVSEYSDVQKQKLPIMKLEMSMRLCEFKLQSISNLLMDETDPDVMSFL